MPLRNSSDPTDVARLEAQARLIAAYEEMKWPRRPPSVADLIRHLMYQHGLSRADLMAYGILGRTLFAVLRFRASAPLGVAAV